MKRTPRAKAACYRLDSDLAYNQPTVTVKIDSSKARISRQLCKPRRSLAVLLGGNYINRFNLEGRSYQVIPQVPRGQRALAEALGSYYIRPNTGQQLPRVDGWGRSRPGPIRIR